MNERVKELRKFLGLTQEKFGERIGIKKNSLSQIENGTNNLTEQMFKSICREFNVNEDWLRNGTGEMFVILDKEAYLFKWIGGILKDNETFQHQFVSLLSQLDDEGWEVLEAFCKKFNILDTKKES